MYRLRAKPFLEQLESRLVLNAGQFDPSFGTGGVASVPFTGSSPEAEADLIQPNGNIVLAGTAQTSTFSDSIVLARLLPNGAPDPSFGTGGQVSALSGVVGTVSLALQSDGKILAATTLNLTNTVGIAVTRFLPNGAVDSAFGFSGTITLPNVNSGGLALQPDGKILVVGTPNNLQSGGVVFAGRLNPDGSLDTSFGSGGTTILTLSSQLLIGTFGVGLQPDGRSIILAGSQTGLILTRLLANGTEDTSFGTGGQEDVANVQPAGLSLYPNGRIIVAGSSQQTSQSQPGIVALRFEPNGTLDPNFGSGGIASVQGAALASSVSVDGTGRIFLGGSSTAQVGTTELLVARLNPNGSNDPAFGANGVVIGGVGTNFSTTAIAVQPDGKLVAAVAMGNIASKAVRFTGDDPLPTANQQFVAQVYLDLLSRPADAPGLAAWSSLLDQGTSRQLVALAIERSPESVTDSVNFLYAKYLHRQADPQGLQIWTAYLLGGGTVDALSTTLASSPEFLAGQGQGTGDGFLNALYQDALNRSVDAPSLAFWHQQFAEGVTPLQIAAFIFTSQEYRYDVVEFGYTTYLRRTGDPLGVQTYVSALSAGVRDGVFLSVLIGSDEYFQMVT